jgi:hypothetical protein
VRVEGTAEVLFKGDVTKASEIRRYEKKEELGTWGHVRALPPLHLSLHR